MQVKKQAVIYHENTKKNLGTPKKNNFPYTTRVTEEGEFF